MMPQPHYPLKECLNLLSRRLGGTQSQSRRFSDEKNLSPLLGFEPQMVQPVPPFTGFSRFSSTYECQPFMEAVQRALNNGTCAVFWKFICNMFRQ